MSVVVLRLGYVKPDGSSMSLVDAVYFTVETIATVGYGDFSFAEQATWLRVFAIALMGLGAVVGLGAVGLEVVGMLRKAGRRVVVVERDEEGRHVARARALGVPVVVGDATDVAVLATANLEAVGSVAVLTSDDMTNIETALVVRDQLGDRWSSVPVVLRVFDRELGTGVQDGFGFDHVRSTSAPAAPWFVGAALGLDVLATFYVVGRLAVAARGGLDGLAMGDLSERTRVVAIERAGRERVIEHPPRRETRFGAGDDAYLVGPYDELLQLLRRARRPAASPDGPSSTQPRPASTPGMEMP